MVSKNSQHIPDPALQSAAGTSTLLITAQQVANLLQTSVRTVWRMRSSGQLPAPVQVGGSIRWRRSDIESWINHGCPEQLISDNNPRRN